MNFNLSNLLAPEYLPYVLPAAVGLAAVLVVVLLLLGRKKGTVKPPVQAAGGKKSSQWAVLNGQSYADRRTSLRREGAPVEVEVASPALRGNNAGYVLDRSTGGLRLALASGMAPGSTLQVRAKHAPDNTPWVTVIVRNCHTDGEHFEVGCEFENTPPWNVLLLFG